MKPMNPKLRVLVKYFYPVAAGIETNILETYDPLAESGWDVELYTTTDTLTQSNVLKQSETLRHINIHRFPWHWFGYFPKIDLGQGSLLCLHNFNITPHMFYLVKSIWDTLAKRKNYTVILTPHGGFTPEWSTFPIVQRAVKWLYHRSIGVWLINLGVDGVRAVSEWERNEMIRCGLRPNLVTVISNGIENAAFDNTDDQLDTAFKKKVAAYGKYIIQVGRIHPIKNFETPIAALANLPKDLKFMILGPVGDPSYKLMLEQQITKLGLQDRVIFLGVVRGAEKFYLMKHAQMMVHMAIWESYCNVVHEGMSQGLVCIVADNTALPLLIKNGVNGYCLPAKNIKALASKIRFVLEHKQSAEIIAIEQRNKLQVREHSWTNVSKRMAAWYTSFV